MKKELNTHDRIVEAYQKGFAAGKKRGEEGEHFKNGVDWRILVVNCGCGQEIIPCADEYDEDLVFFEKRAEFLGQKCEVCGEQYQCVMEEGNMASKRNPTMA